MNKENLDQHFMIDKELIKRIVDYSHLKQQDIVLEIGPGKGALTSKLLEKSKVIAIELDNDLCDKLKEKFKEANNLKIMRGNALKKILELDFNKIVSNIPYSISEPLITKILILQPEFVILTAGKNFEYYLTNNLLLNLIYNIEIKETVPKSAFYPEPNTDSIIVELKIKKDTGANLFKDLLKQHDKKLKNALINSLQDKLTKNQVREKIRDLEFKNKSILNIKKEEIQKLIKSIY